MKFLFLSKNGDGLGLAQRIVDEGHNVSMYIENPNYKQAGINIINRIGSWRPSLHDSDIVICDTVGFGKYEKTFNRMNKPVLSCSRFLEQADTNIEKSIELFKNADINIPVTTIYDRAHEAKELLPNWKSGYVIKYRNEQKIDKVLIIHNKQDWEWVLSMYGGAITVQEIIEDGIGISIEGWFNGRMFINPFTHIFKERNLISSNSGPDAGCMGNVVINAKSGNRLTSETIQKFEPLLKKISYRGPVTINSIVTKANVYALSLNTRISYDAIEALMEGLNEPISDVLFETAMGTNTSMNLGTDYMIAVRLSKAPWPITSPPINDIGMPILGINDSNKSHIFLTDVYSNGLDKENDEILYAASGGVIAKVTAHAKTITDLRARVYRTVKSIKYMGKQYRIDIGDRVINDIKRLKDWGWI